MNWDNLALQSEIAYSQARGGAATRREGFIHIHNRHVPWGGDFNRAVGCQASSFAAFREIETAVQKIHAENLLAAPDRFDCFPPSLDKAEWAPFLSPLGYSCHDLIFFAAAARPAPHSGDVRLHRPTENDYLEWHEARLRKADHFDEQWFREIMPLEKHFAKEFLPYWLVRGDELLGSVHCAHLGECSRLFDVEIEEKHRGRGYGKILLDLIRDAARRAGSSHALLQSAEPLRPFYEKAGFFECSRNTVIRLK